MSDNNKDLAGQPGMSPKDKQMMNRRSFLGKMGVALGVTTAAAVIGPDAVRQIATSPPAAEKPSQSPVKDASAESADVLLRPAQVEEQLKQYDMKFVEFGADGTAPFEATEPVAIISEDPADTYFVQYDSAAGRPVTVQGADAAVLLINSPGRTKLTLSSDIASSAATTGVPRSETKRVWVLPLKKDGETTGGQAVGSLLQEVARNSVVQTNILRKHGNGEEAFTVRTVSEASDTPTISTVSAPLGDLPARMAEAIPMGAVKFTSPSA